tara:strand:- start:426 stop:671 length:246 start_codon:yes stop_codon:yes gene_type:complete
MSLEEYLALHDALHQQGVIMRTPSAKRIESKPKRAGKKDPKMARALKKANSIGRTKSGKLRKGYTQARIMKKAHQLRRKMK